jgi:hypothetical protein
MAGPSELVVKAFLSHSYKASSVNLFFYDLFSDAARVQFNVDARKIAMNVTRLERMVRDADAFIGIYPFEPDGAVGAPNRNQLLNLTRYFRFELDLAIRSGKPALVFSDRRYAGILKAPGGVQFSLFETHEVTSEGGPSNAERFRRDFSQFCQRVAAAKKYSLELDRPEGTGIGILLPRYGDASGYGTDKIELIHSVLEERGRDLHEIRWPPTLDLPCFALLQQVDWVLVDITDPRCASLATYLHGQSIPMMRLLWEPHAGTSEQLVVEKTLYGGLEVGYRKDVLRWHDTVSLEQGLRDRLGSLDEEFDWISTKGQAEAYFLKASLRKEPVFLSYSRRDQDVARALSLALKRSFKSVFDYRDGQSVQPGHNWKDQVHDELSASALGIALLSGSYLESPYCVREARLMDDYRLRNKLRFIAVKLYDEKLDLPDWLADDQYIRWWEHENVDKLVELIRQAVASDEPPGTASLA